MGEVGGCVGEVGQCGEEGVSEVGRCGEEGVWVRWDGVGRRVCG